MRSAMYYGLLLGIFWVIKYIFFIWGSSSPLMGAVYWVLTPFTIVIAYAFTRMYKIQIGGKIGFFHAWQFGILLYFFAALIVSLAHYVFYQYIAPPDFIATSMDQVIHMMKEMDLNSPMKDAIDQLSTPTPIQMAIQGIFNNVFYGVVFSIPIAALLCRNNETGFINHTNEEEDNL